MLLLLFQVAVAHPADPLIALQSVHELDDVAPALLVLPFPHAVQLDDPAVLYEPATHCVPVYVVVPPSLL